MNYEKEMAFAKNLALEAGGLMRQYFLSEQLGTERKSDNSPLTVADTAINDLVINQVKEIFPDHGVLGEEDSYEPDREYVWVVDPIDGTLPYSIGIPMSTFLLALVDRQDGQPRVAVSYDPHLEELYSAVQGGGAFVNGKPLQTTSDESLQHNYVALGLRSYKDGDISYDGPKVFAAMRDNDTWVLNMPSGGYFANRVAGGQLAAVAYANLGGVWDLAAPALIIQEAGGVVTDIAGQPRRFDEIGRGSIMAANQAIVDQLVKVIRDNENPGH